MQAEYNDQNNYGLVHVDDISVKDSDQISVVCKFGLTTNKTEKITKKVVLPKRNISNLSKYLRKVAPFL
jgi:hypothetical protein